MSLSDRKEEKKEAPHTEFPPFYEIPAAISGDFTVEIDTFSRALIKKGNSRALNLFDDEVKATLGQRYVMAAFIKDHVVHLRAIPGFEFVEDEAKRKALAKKAATFFKCTEEDIAFPDHAIWTGVVHEQLISRIKQKEPELKAIIVPFSMIKNNGKYTWLNRSARNADIFSPYALANACYVFEGKSDYTDYKPPKFDLFYHLTRSIPEAFFKKLSTDATETICADDPTPLVHYVLDECTNFAYEAKWDVLRKLYKSDRAKAIEQIQRMLMRNLHVFLSDLSAPDYKERALAILKEGFIEAEKLDIPINIDFIPPEFEGHDRALIKSERSEFEDLHDFLKRFQYRYFAIIIKTNDVEMLAEILINANVDLRKDIFAVYIHHAIKQNKPENIAVLYAACEAENEEVIIKLLTELFCEAILAANLADAKKYIQAIPKVMLSVLKQPTEVLVPSTLSLLLYHFAETLLEEKPDFNKKNVYGQTLLHLAARESCMLSLISLLNNNADPNSLDNEGFSPLHYAAKSESNNFKMVDVLLANKANPNAKEGLPSPLEYVLEGGKHASVQLLLSYGALFPDSPKAVEQLHATLQSSIRLFQFGIFTVLMKTIISQKPAIQLKLLNIIYQLFNESIGNISTAGAHVKTILNLLQLSNAPIHDAIDVDLKLLMNSFFKFVQTISDNDDKLKLINAMLDSRSFIGQRLILDKMHGEAFHKELGIMQMRFDLDIKFGYFIDSIIMGNLEEAKEYVKSVPSKLFLPYFQEHSESPYFMRHFMCRFAETILEEKPDFNKKVEGETLLHAVVKWSECSRTLVRSLLKNADPNILNDEKDSALSLAARNENWPVVYVLLLKGADPNLSNPEKNSPLECALRSREYQVAKVLLEDGAKFPASCALDTMDVKKIMENLFLMISSFLNRLETLNILDTITQTIKIQEDPIIKSRIMNVIFDLFYLKVERSNFIAVLKFLQMTKLPSLEVTHFDQQIFTDKFYSFLQECPDSRKLELINTVLDTKSSIGQRLLKTDSSAKMFTPGTFLEKLNKMKTTLELETKPEKKM